MSKIIKDNELNKILGKSIVLVGGCFDVIHPAHIEFLTRAKNEGDKLVIMLENDENIKKLKGKTRPLNNQITRAKNLSKLGFIDYIILLNTPISSDYYYNLVKLLRPAIIAVTEGDPLTGVKKDQAALVGGKVVEVMRRDSKHSTTKKLSKEE